MDILSITELADERLAEYAAEVRAAFDALAELDTPTAEQISEAETYADHLDAIAAEQAARSTAAAELADRAAALRTRFAEPAEPEVEVEVEVVEEEPVEAAVVETPAVPAVASVRTIAARTVRPPTPVATRHPVTITAAADVPEFSTGSAIEDMSTVGKALVNRMRGFGTPSGNGLTQNLQHYGVASFRMNFPKELTIDRGSDDMEVLEYARKESRLPGNSLVAAGGWCAPSETIYDLCVNETLEGLVSIPEVHIARGGINYTTGPDFAAIYDAIGFCQTETEAIAGTEKPCFEVPCPDFTEVRLDACGICIKAPILTNAAYPELVQRWLTGSLVAFEHQINNKVLLALVDGSTARTPTTGFGTTAGDTLAALEFEAEVMRDRYRMSQTMTMEVIVPFWVKAAIRQDLAQRSGQEATDVITDQVIAAHFAARHLNVQYVYDWQDLANTDLGYPSTFQALMYPAGTFIKGTADVINLNAVYDAASLATNIYTALFYETGILVAKMCNDAVVVTIPICNAGTTGANEFTCS